MRFSFIYPILTLILVSASACNAPAGSNPNGSTSVTGTTQTLPAGTSSTQSSAPAGAPPRTYTTDALLFNGSGTWGSEIASLENILKTNGASYSLVGSAELNAMSVSDLAKFGLLIFPGGAGGTEAGSLTAQTHANIRAAVQQQGVSYLGFCAGAFIAAAPAPAAGQDVSYGLGVLDGPVMGYYYLENQGQDIAMTLYTLADGTTADVLYYGGPVTPNKGVIAKYPNGDPAISEVWSGNGLVIVSGGHPTATQAILNVLGMKSTDGTHEALTWKLINAALHQQPLPTF